MEIKEIKMTRNLNTSNISKFNSFGKRDTEKLTLVIKLKTILMKPKLKINYLQKLNFSFREI